VEEKRTRGMGVKRVSSDNSNSSDSPTQAAARPEWLESIDIPEIEEYPADSSVKLNGPPGCGKTFTAGARVGICISELGYDISDVAWVTYRTSLAQETLERFGEWNLVSSWELDDPMSGSTKQIGTIHAIARRLLGINKDRVEPGHKTEFCKKVLNFDYNSDDRKGAGNQLFSCFNWLCNNLYDPGDRSDVTEWPNSDQARGDLIIDTGGISITPNKLVKYWEAWNAYKSRKDLVDFHEMLSQAFKSDLSPVGENGILVVDEYHDVTPLMAAVCEDWIEDAGTVIVAGDPLQVVNSFDGADPKYFNRIDLPEVVLPRSYRLPKEFLDFARRIISKSGEIMPEIEPDRNESGDPRTGTIYTHKLPPKIDGDYQYEDTMLDVHGQVFNGYKVPAPDRESSPVSIVDNAREESDGGSDVMFLARTRFQTEGIASALGYGGVIYTGQENLNGWDTESDRKGTKDRTHLFDALQRIRGITAGSFEGTNANQGLSAFGGGVSSRIDPMNVTLRPEELEALVYYTQSGHHELSRSDINQKMRIFVDEGKPVSLHTLAGWVEPEFWTAYTNGSASVQKLNESRGGSNQSGGMNDHDRALLTRSLTRYPPGTTISGPIPGANDPNDGRVGDIEDVKVMTIHASKGSEAEDVVVYDGITGNIKRGIMKQGTDEMLNEHRVWYVAVTRASERLHVMLNDGGFEFVTPFLTPRMG